MPIMADQKRKEMYDGCECYHPHLQTIYVQAYFCSSLCREPSLTASAGANEQVCGHVLTLCGTGGGQRSGTHCQSSAVFGVRSSQVKD